MSDLGEKKWAETIDLMRTLQRTAISGLRVMIEDLANDKPAQSILAGGIVAFIDSYGEVATAINNLAHYCQGAGIMTDDGLAKHQTTRNESSVDADFVNAFMSSVTGEVTPELKKRAREILGDEAADAAEAEMKEIEGNATRPAWDLIL